MLRRLLFLLPCLFLIACAALLGFNERAELISNVDSSISDIRSMISTVIPVGQRAISPNGREILSVHFVLNSKGEPRPAAEAVERWFARYLILGDRRPYNIEVYATRERRFMKNGQYSYEPYASEPRLAKRLAKALQTELTKRREDRNIIDDFRVF